MTLLDEWAVKPQHKQNFQTAIKKDKRKVQVVPQSQTAALPRHQEEEATNKTKQT